MLDSHNYEDLQLKDFEDNTWTKYILVEDWKSWMQQKEENV